MISKPKLPKADLIKYAPGKGLVVSLFVSLFFSALALANTCPSLLMRADQQHSKSPYINGQSFCDLHERYQHLIHKAKILGMMHPGRISNLLAPRLIDFYRWEKNKEKYNYDPRFFYQPAPLTWDNWNRAIEKINQISEENIAAQQISPITPDLVKSLHRTTLQNLSQTAGTYRAETEYGYNFDERLKGSDILSLINKSIIPGSLHPEKPMDQWKSTKCTNELSLKVMSRVSAEARKGLFIYKPEEWEKPLSEQSLPLTNDSMECGVIIYPPHQELRREMKLWAKNINDHIDIWNNSDLVIDEDPILTIARAQRWLVSIHPFMDGNGRPSRYVLDLLFQSLQLPPPILLDKDKDLYSSDHEWAFEVGKGLLKHLEILESCVNHSNNQGCNLIQ